MNESEHMVNKGKGTQADVLKIMFIKSIIYDKKCVYLSFLLSVEGKSNLVAY